MIDCKDIKLCSLELIKSIKRRKPINKLDEGKIVMLMNIYIDKLIFNIASLCALLCLKMGVKQILNNHMSYLIHYINKYCNSARITGKSTTVIVSTRGGMRGGAFNTAAFFGVDESRHYRAENVSGDIMNIDFANNVARPALGLQMTGGACSKLNKAVKKKMKKIFNNFNVKISDKMLDVIMEQFNEIFNNFIKKLTDTKATELKYANFKKLIYKSKIMKNDI
jgi:hypothetical protein|uniref:Uncharacterized protein n=1 Tax=viral metagenome TaxID=1070528 RepID=A0A6C0LE27_9ZZZZ